VNFGNTHKRTSHQTLEKPYDLAELVDFAEQHNPQTRAAWQNAKAQAAALGVARSELYPTLAAAGLVGVDRTEAFLGTRFFDKRLAIFRPLSGIRTRTHRHYDPLRSPLSSHSCSSWPTRNQRSSPGFGPSVIL
jgi:Outer membrane efflux protein